MKEEQISINKKSVLIVVDMQNDFLPNGSLAVHESDKIIDGINNCANLFREKGYVIFSQDWHPKNHGSFASAYSDKKPGDPINLPGLGPILWPDHCVQKTDGAAFHPNMKDEYAIAIIRKGYNPEIDSYSVFYENDKKTSTGLTGLLKGLKIENVFICGVATDYCCFFSAMDAKKEGFNTYFILDLTKGIDIPKGNLDKTVESMKNANIHIISSNQIQ